MTTNDEIDWKAAEAKLRAMSPEERKQRLAETDALLAEMQQDQEARDKERAERKAEHDRRTAQRDAAWLRDFDFGLVMGVSENAYLAALRLLWERRPRALGDDPQNVLAAAVGDLAKAADDHMKAIKRATENQVKAIEAARKDKSV